MTPFDRRLRAKVYELLVDQVGEVDAEVLAVAGGWDRDDVEESLRGLANAHRLTLTSDGRVRMAHPFSGVPTEYRTSIGDRWWYANCAWDSLAILALLGDGEASGPGGLVWTTEDGVVSPDGLIHLLVPARRFWRDIEFT